MRLSFVAPPMERRRMKSVVKLFSPTVFYFVPVNMSCISARDVASVMSRTS